MSILNLFKKKSQTAPVKRIPVFDGNDFDIPLDPIEENITPGYWMVTGESYSSGLFFNNHTVTRTWIASRNHGYRGCDMENRKNQRCLTGCFDNPRVCKHFLRTAQEVQTNSTSGGDGHCGDRWERNSSVKAAWKKSCHKDNPMGLDGRYYEPAPERHTTKRYTGYIDSVNSYIDATEFCKVCGLSLSGSNFFYIGDHLREEDTQCMGCDNPIITNRSEEVDS